MLQYVVDKKIRILYGGTFCLISKQYEEIEYDN